MQEMTLWPTPNKKIVVHLFLDFWNVKHHKLPSHVKQEQRKGKFRRDKSGFTCLRITAVRTADFSTKHSVSQDITFSNATRHTASRTLKIQTADRLYVNWTNSRKQIPWEVNSPSASQEMPCLLQNLMVHYCVPNSLPCVPILSQMNSIHITTHLFKIH
jgi:hypothetical protein